MAAPPEPHDRVPSAFGRWINDGGERHPVENLLALLSLVLGVASVVCLTFGLWEAAAWTGLVGGLVAAYDEFISKTSGQRWLILAGFLLCLVGLAVSMANGAIF